jgi:hypothetical protein
MRVEHLLWMLFNVSVELDPPYCPAKALALHSTFYYQDPGPGPKADQFGCNSRDLRRPLLVFHRAELADGRGLPGDRPREPKNPRGTHWNQPTGATSKSIPSNAEPVPILDIPSHTTHPRQPRQPTSTHLAHLTHAGGDEAARTLKLTACLAPASYLKVAWLAAAIDGSRYGT